MTESGDWGGSSIKKKTKYLQINIDLVGSIFIFWSNFLLFFIHPCSTKSHSFVKQLSMFFFIFAYIYVESTGVLLKGFKTWVAKGYAW